MTNRRRPILFFVADHSPGVHDMLVAACDPTRYGSRLAYLPFPGASTARVPRD